MHSVDTLADSMSYTWTMFALFTLTAMAMLIEEGNAKVMTANRLHVHRKRTNHTNAIV